MSVRVFNAELHAELSQPVALRLPPPPEASPELDEERTRRKAARSARRQLQAAKVAALNEKYRLAVEARDRETRLQQAAARAAKEAALQRMLEACEAGGVESVNEHFERDRVARARRREFLYREWSHEVFERLRDEIAATLARTSTSDIERRRRNQLASYLAAVARNQGLFRDIINPAQYDPLAWTATAPRVDASALRDPLLKPLAVAAEEEKLLQAVRDAQPQQTPPLPQTHAQRDRSQRLDILLWDKLEATPHGRYAKMFAAEAAATARPRPRAALQSTLRLDHFDIDRDPRTVKREFFPGGKRVPAARTRAPSA